jgi:hypothetical protein
MVVKMKLFKLLLMSTVVVSAANAEIDLLGQSMMFDQDLGQSFIAIQHRGKLVEDAARAADAAYNELDLVALKSKSTPITARMDASERESLEAQGHDIITFSATSTEHGHVPAGMVTYSEIDGKARITLSYHGSESVEDFTEANLLALKQKNTEVGIDGYVHGGFNNRYMQSRESMMDSIEILLSNHGKTIKDVEVLVTGHSLGGALATLGAFDIKKNLGADKIKLVTYSSPRVLDAKGAKQMEKLFEGNDIFRIWRKNDLVPTLSLGTNWFFGYFTGFKHIGQSVKLASKAGFGSLENHIHGHNKAEALSPEKAEFDLNHVGYRTWMGNKVSQVVNTPLAVGGYIKSSIGSWLSRS